MGRFCFFGGNGNRSTKILGLVLMAAGVLILLSLPGGEEPVTAEDYWLVGCAILGGGALLYRALGRKKKKA